MKVVIAYCPDVAVLRQNIEELEKQGLYPQHVCRTIGFMVEDVIIEPKVITTGARSKTAASTSQVENESICQFAISQRDVTGDPDDPSYIPFLTAAGLESLAYGENGDEVLNLLQADPEALVIYERFFPPVQDTDEEGNPVGDPRFQPCTQFAV